MKLRAQEMLQRFKLGIRDWKLRGDILHDKRGRAVRPLLRFALIEVHMLCHAALLDSGGADLETATCNILGQDMIMPQGPMLLCSLTLSQTLGNFR